MYCRKCGVQIADDSTYCYKCGAKITISESSEDTFEIIANRTPPVQCTLKILLIGNIEEKYIPYTKNYGRNFSLLVSLIDSSGRGTISDGLLTVAVTNKQEPLKLRGKPEDLSKVVSPGKPRIFDFGIAQRLPYAQLAAQINGMAVNYLYFGHANIPVFSQEFKEKEFTNVKTGAKQKILGYSYTCPEVVFVPKDEWAYIHIWFLTKDNRLIYGQYGGISWTDMSGKWFL